MLLLCLVNIGNFGLRDDSREAGGVGRGLIGFRCCELDVIY